MREVTIRVLAHKGDSKGEIRYVIHVVYCDISVVIPSAQQEAKHVGSVVSQCRLRVVLSVQWVFVIDPPELPLVIKGRGMSLLGKMTATELGVLKVGINIAMVTGKADSLKQQYPEVFEGVKQTNRYPWI